jgi:hypothetical protein
MGAQRLIAARLVEPSIVIEIAKRSREAVGTVLERHAAKRKERVLQADGDLWVILPISSRKSSSITGGIRLVGVASGAITMSEGLRATSSMSRRRPV